VIAGSLLGPRLIALLSARWTAAGGFVLITGGCLALACLPDVGVPTGRLITAFGLMGTGLGLVSTASTAAGTDAAPAPHRGVASGLLNATAQIGTALGLALVVPMVARTPNAASLRWGFATAGLIAVLGLAACHLLPADRHGPGRLDPVGGGDGRFDQRTCRRSEVMSATGCPDGGPPGRPGTGGIRGAAATKPSIA
jgi:MFS family permease